MCLRLGEPRWGLLRQGRSTVAGARSRGPGRLLRRSPSALGLSFPSGEMGGGGLLVSSRCGVDLRPAPRLPFLAEVGPPGERRGAGESSLHLAQLREQRRGSGSQGARSRRLPALRFLRPESSHSHSFHCPSQEGREGPMALRIQTKEGD